MTSASTSKRADCASETFTLEGGLSASLLVGIGIALAVEGAGLHLWIASRSQPWAWTITAINGATLVWLWRDYQARTRSALTVREDDIAIAIGTQLRCRFPRSALASVAVATWRSVPEMASDYVNTAKPLEPNVMLVFREPVDARLAFGIRKRVTRLGVRVADPELLISAIASIQNRR